MRSVHSTSSPRLAIRPGEISWVAIYEEGEPRHEPDSHFGLLFIRHYVLTWPALDRGIVSPCP